MLTESQTDLNFMKPSYGSFVIIMQGLRYSLNASNVNCSQINQLCAQFTKGHDPILRNPKLPFEVEGVVDEFNNSSAPGNLVGCTPFRKCQGKIHPALIKTFNIL